MGDVSEFEPLPGYLSTVEVGQYLGVSWKTVNRIVNEYDIEVYGFSGSIAIPESSVPAIKSHIRKYRND